MKEIIKKQEELIRIQGDLCIRYKRQDEMPVKWWLDRYIEISQLESELTALKSEKPTDEAKKQIAHHYSDGEVYKRLGGVVLKKDNAIREQLLVLIDRFEKAPFSQPSRFADELIDLFQPQGEKPSVDDSGIIAVNIASKLTPKLTASEESMFVAGFQECVKYLSEHIVYAKAGMFELFRNYMETIAPVRFKQIFESMDEDDGILIEECFHYFARMAMEEYKSTDLRREPIDIIDCIVKFDSGETLEAKGEYFEVIQRDLRNLQSRNETTKEK
jgi:hypothetical protein